MDPVAAAAAAVGDRSRRWVKEWVPQDLIVAGGSCSLYKWVREDQLAALREKSKEQDTEVAKPEPEPTTEVLFLCSYEGCGKTFIDAGALRKHAHIHGEKQYVCHFANCGKRFLDSSKLKRHFYVHTGEKNFICPHEGCGKAFSLDFNLKAHMKTHLPENYHICPYPECGRRFTQQSKLNGHIRAQHERSAGMSTSRAAQAQADNNIHGTARSSATAQAASADRPFACPYEGCGKAYIHEYKLNLHLRKEHPGHTPEAGNQVSVAKGSASKNSRRSKPSLARKMPPAKAAKRGTFSMPPPVVNTVEDQWKRETGEVYNGDSEETEEDEESGDDDEATEDED